MRASSSCSRCSSFSPPDSAAACRQRRASRHWKTAQATQAEQTNDQKDRHFLNPLSALNTSSVLKTMGQYTARSAICHIRLNIEPVPFTRCGKYLAGVGTDFIYRTEIAVQEYAAVLIALQDAALFGAFDGELAPEMRVHSSRKCRASRSTSRSVT